MRIRADKVFMSAVYAGRCRRRIRRATSAPATKADKSKGPGKIPALLILRFQTPF
jgi:hypothetical protein